MRSMRNKIKKYRNQIQKLKEKIKAQNIDIEEALNRLSVN